MKSLLREVVPALTPERKSGSHEMITSAWATALPGEVTTSLGTVHPARLSVACGSFVTAFTDEPFS